MPNMPADIAIVNGYLLPMNNQPPIEQGALTILDGTILQLGRRDEVCVTGARRIIDAQGGAIMPGLVNCHTHNASNMLLRGLLEDVELFEWLSTMWRLKQNFDHETLYWASLCGLIEMVRAGVTCFNEHFDAYKVEPEVEALRVLPLRATLGYGFADRGLYQSITEWSWDCLHHFERKMALHHNSMQGRLQVALSPHAPYSCGPQMWQLARKVADEYGVAIHTHIAEGLIEVGYVRDNYQTTPVQWLHSLGVLGPDVTAAHCTRMNAEDIRLMAESQVKIAHCPVCNGKLVSGTMDLQAVLEAGITVGLATDGPASQNTLDLFQEMKFAGVIHKDRTQDPKFLKTREILNLATTGSAKAMHRPESGQLSVGAAADVIVVDLHTPHTLPVYDPEATLVYASRADDVRYTLVAGQVLLDNKVVVGVNEIEVMQNFQRSAYALRNRSLKA